MENRRSRDCSLFPHLISFVVVMSFALTFFILSFEAIPRRSFVDDQDIPLCLGDQSAKNLCCLDEQEARNRMKLDVQALKARNSGLGPCSSQDELVPDPANPNRGTKTLQPSGWIKANREEKKNPTQKDKQPKTLRYGYGNTRAGFYQSKIFKCKRSYTFKYPGSENSVTTQYFATIDHNNGHGTHSAHFHIRPADLKIKDSDQISVDIQELRNKKKRKEKEQKEYSEAMKVWTAKQKKDPKKFFPEPTPPLADEDDDGDEEQNLTEEWAFYRVYDFSQAEVSPCIPLHYFYPVVATTEPITKLWSENCRKFPISEKQSKTKNQKLIETYSKLDKNNSEACQVWRQNRMNTML